MLNQSGKIVLVLALFLLLLGTGAYFFYPSFKSQKYTDPSSSSLIVNNKASEEMNISTDGTKDYASQDFKMTLKVPGNFEIEDSFPIFYLKNGTQMIEIIRNGTNFENLNDYLQDFDSKRSVKEVNTVEENISDYSVVSRETVDEGSGLKQKSYYLYTDNYVYIFSTSDEILYPVLDQMVQSFEYKGTLSSGEDKP